MPALPQSQTLRRAIRMRLPSVRTASPRRRRNLASREPATSTFPVWSKTKTEFGEARLLKEAQLSMLHSTMLIRLTPKSTRFGDDFVGTVAHWMLAGLSPLHFGCCHEPVYSASYVGATACPLIPSNDRNALNG